MELIALDLGPIGPDCIPTIDCIRRGLGPFDVEGTLLIAIRSAYTVDGVIDWDIDGGGRVQDRHQGVLILGGMAFIEGVKVGTDLEGGDPTRVVEQTCLMLAGKDFERLTPGLEAWRIRVEERRREDQERREQDERKREVAASKARAILTAYLNEEQLVEFEDTGEFHVIGADGFKYLVTNKGHHNVFRIEDGKRTHMYCIVSRGYVPDHDQMLSQMFLLQADPTMFHEIANTWEMGEDDHWKLVRKGREPVFENAFEIDLQAMRAMRAALV